MFNLPGTSICFVEVERNSRTAKLAQRLFFRRIPDTQESHERKHAFNAIKRELRRLTCHLHLSVAMLLNSPSPGLRRSQRLGVHLAASFSTAVTVPGRPCGRSLRSRRGFQRGHLSETAQAQQAATIPFATRPTLAPVQQSRVPCETTEFFRDV